MSAALLELRGVRKAFSGVDVLRGVNLTVRAGETHALVGANGAGKSTLIKILAGAYSRDAGELSLDGSPLTITQPRDALRHGIAVIYQELNLAPELTVAENLLIGQEPIRRRLGVPMVDRDELFRTAEAHLRDLGFPLDARRLIRDLGTGQKQLVEIARALYRQARVVVLDEPTAALSHVESRRLFQLIGDLKKRGIGMIYISHHLEEVMEVADHVTVLRDGAVAGSWTAPEVTQERIIEAMVGQELAHEEHPVPPPGETVAEFRDFSGDGFERVSLALGRGEIVALTGAAGAGQTDLLWAAVGARRSSSGKMLLAGEPVGRLNPRRAAARGIRFAPGDRKAFGIVPLMGVGPNFLFPALGKWSPGPILNPSRLRSTARSLITKYGVRCSSEDQPIHLLSGGNQQKVVVGRIAELPAKLYLFDEPTRGVDIGARTEIYRIIRNLAESGAAVLVATPDLQEARLLGHRIGVFRGGKLVLQCPARQASEHALLEALLGSDNPSKVSGSSERRGDGG